MKIEDFIGLEVLSGDARVIGTVEGVGVDVTSWRVPVLKIGIKKGMEESLGIKKPRFGSTTIYVRTEEIESISDMITLKPELENSKEAIIEGKVDIPTAGSIVGTRVIARGGKQMGFVDNFLFAPKKDWAIACMMVKMEKAVLSELKIKKPRIGTPVIKVLTEDIKTIGDMVMLKIDLQELRDYLDKKPRKKRVEEPKDRPSASSGLPPEFRDDQVDEEEQRARRLENL